MIRKACNSLVRCRTRQGVLLAAGGCGRQSLPVISAEHIRYFSGSSGGTGNGSAAEEAAVHGTNHHNSLPAPVVPHALSPTRLVPSHIVRPPYADSGKVPSSFFPEKVILHDEASISRMRDAARLARQVLDLACSLAQVGVTTDEIDEAVHNAIIEQNAYPSPLNYAGFPKSLCSSVNDVICHGIPDLRPLQFGDVVSFDVSCFLNGVHGDNCATVIVGDCESEPGNAAGKDWRGVPYKFNFECEEDEGFFVEARRLVRATREGLYAAIDVCRPGRCLSQVGFEIHHVAESYGFNTVEKYRGHGISHQFHCAPYVKHFRNTDKMELRPGMIFTIEPMFTLDQQDCFEWDDEWTVATVDGSIAAQFEHTILITEGKPEILTVSH